MSIILHIDTAESKAFVSLSKDGGVIDFLENTDQKSHAAFVHPAILELFAKSGINRSAVDAIAVTNGPGSYTGLRVGLATAKGLAFALEKPLICINTLEIMACSMAFHDEVRKETGMLLCPLIDARRMEVFTALYDQSLTEIKVPQAVILNEESFANILCNFKICFAGTGAEKLESILRNQNALFINDPARLHASAVLAQKFFQTNAFSDLMTTEPFYVKLFQSSPDKTMTQNNFF